MDPTWDFVGVISHRDYVTYILFTCHIYDAGFFLQMGERIQQFLSLLESLNQKHGLSTGETGELSRLARLANVRNFSWGQHSRLHQRQKSSKQRRYHGVSEHDAWQHTVDSIVFAKSSIVVMIWYQSVDTKIAD